MNLRKYGAKFVALLTLNVTLATAGGCSLEELFPIQEFTQDFVLGWVSALLL